MTLLWCINTEMFHVYVLIHSDRFVMPKHKSFGKIWRILEIISYKHLLATLACYKSQL